MIEIILKKAAVMMLSRSMAHALIDYYGKVDAKKYRRSRKRLRAIRRELRRNSTILDDIHQACWASLTPITSPIALVSQIQRSGGSLLSQLFDGHPQLHAHPHELKIGFPKKHIWPKLDRRDSPERWFEMLFEQDVIRHFKNGYEKDQRDGRTFAFIFPPALQRKLFLACLNGRVNPTARDIVDAYMTSYFHAWLNNLNIRGGKKYITAFTPRLSVPPESMRSFFETYPDGRLISLVRDPRNWYPSARGHETAKNKYDDICQAMDQWNESADAMIRNKLEFTERVCLLRFEDLVSKTETVMRYLASFLEIDFDPILLTPTFNRTPILANTSFSHEKGQIQAGTLNRHHLLTAEEIELIGKRSGERYQRVLAAVVSF
jgi:hypothetical protein